MVPSLLRLPTMGVIIAAQIVNGLLLPFVSASLAICLNDRGIMGAALPAAAGLLPTLAPSLAASFFLASMVLFGRSADDGDSDLEQGEAVTSLVPAAGATVAGLAAVAVLVRRARRGAW
mmetsp:Transcript_37887/g.114383  ORF Transcript_37887/g.114383 Transcript_37887/m.114383 type:complete len:119 (-) Transcript_37887:85-441(-)